MNFHPSPTRLDDPSTARRGLRAFAVLSFVALLLVLPSAAAAAPAPGHDLFLAQASGGTLHGSELVLHGVAPRVATFTDRPRREAASLSVERLVADWGRTFGDDPPNAALEVEGAPAGRDVAIVELRRPRLDRRRGTLTFAVTQLRRAGDPVLRSFDARVDPGRVHRFDRASLFIDAGAVTVTPVRMKVDVAAGQTVELGFEAPVYAAGATISGIATPPSAGSISTGGIRIKGGSLSFSATGGVEGFEAEVLIGLEVPPDSKVTGTANIPTGSSVELTVGSEPPVQLSGGRFEAGG